VLDVCVVIATRNRADFLIPLLQRLVELREELAKVVVVDSSDEMHRKMTQDFIDGGGLSGICFEYQISSERSKTRQVNQVFKDCLDFTAIQILDDDVLPDPGYLARSYELLTKHQAIGVSGITQDIRSVAIHKKIFGVVFGLDSFRYGSVSASGVGIPARAGATTTETSVDWLIGCSMWSSQRLVNKEFESKFEGSCLFEDVDFSVKNRKSGKLLVDTSLELFHFSAVQNRPNPELYWFRFARNRIFVLKTISFIPYIQLLRGNIGAAIQILCGSESKKLASLRGLLLGTFSALTNQTVR
jgi:GT2 family glycosyltransferase